MEFGCGLLERVGARAALGGDNNASGEVGQSTSVLMPIAMLTATASAGEPLDTQMTFLERWPAWLMVENSDRNRTGMDAPSALGWWDALNAMATWFIVEA